MNGTAAITATTAAPKRVPLDPAWKSVLECATLEVFEMMAATRLTPYIPPASEQHAPAAAQTQTKRQSGLTAQVSLLFESSPVQISLITES